MADGIIRLRPARVEDALAIAEINVGCWQQAYAGILTPEILNSRSVAAERWHGFLGQPATGLLVLVAEEAGDILGFASAGSQRDD